MRAAAGLMLLGGMAVIPSGTALARVVEAGPGTANPTLAAAVRLAQDGDTIRLAAGDYYECAVLSQRDLVLEGSGPGTRLTDATCEGKAVIVARGDRLTIRDMTLSRARVPDRNGAGIRSEGQGLTVERVRFENNEVGVLGGPSGAAEILIRDCAFLGGGVAGDQPTATLTIGDVGRLRVERSRFEGVKGAQIVSAAHQTEIVGSTVSTGIEPGSGPVVQASGSLLVADSTMAVGPAAPPRRAAIVASGPDVAVRGTTLVNTTGKAAILLLDWSGTSPTLTGNVVAAGDAELSREGLWRHEAGTIKRALSAEARRAAGTAKRAILGVLGR